jgi:hypothetical protein
MLWPLAAALLITACGEAPKPAVKKQEKKAPEAISGQTAFFRVYTVARTWAQDLEALTMTGIHMNAIPAKEGKFPAWRVTFVSPSKRAAKTYQISAITAEGLNEGIYGANEEPFSGQRGQNSPFPIQALKKDSTLAYEAAMKEGAAYAKKYPDMPISFQLEKIQRFSNPVWRVIWGTSAGTSNYSIYVDATSGEYLVTMR